MKNILFRVLLIVTIIFSLNSCSSDSDSASENTTADYTSQKTVNYTYTTFELETLKLINDYRVSVGLNPLEKVNFMSVKSEEHDNYMISTNTVNHDGAVDRSQEIMKVLGAKTVGENVAFNYNTPKAVLDAWLASPGHKENIVGNYTHFGISVRENPTTGKKYYTNIFARI